MFPNVDHGPRHGPFHQRLQQKAPIPPQLQERRRHFVSSGEEVNAPFRHRRNHNSFRSKSIELTAECNLVAPTIDALRECMTATEVAELEAPDKNGLVTYPGSAASFR